VIWSRAFLDAVRACDEGKAWMDANAMWDKPYSVVRTELQRQLDSGEFDTSIASAEEAREWLDWGKKLESNPIALRAGGTIIERDQLEGTIGAKRYSAITEGQAKKVLARHRRQMLEVVSVCAVSRKNGTMSMKPVKRFAQIRNGTEYAVHNPKTGRHIFVTGRSEVVRLVEDFYPARVRKDRLRRKIEDAEGFMAKELYDVR
jgi:hypothetical protein